jgi:hypothetical protein
MLAEDSDNSKVNVDNVQKFPFGETQLPFGQIELP